MLTKSERQSFYEHLKTVGNRFRKHREEKKKTLREVSKETEISLHLLKRIEAGLMADLELVLLWALADYYCVPFSEIYEG